MDLARQARIGYRVHMSVATHSLEAGSSFFVCKKESASDTRRLFFYGLENCFRLRGNASPETHAPGVHRALGALLCGQGNGFRLRGNAPISTHVPGVHRALGALFYGAKKRLPASRECADFDTCPRCSPRAWRALQRRKVSDIMHHEWGVSEL